MIYYLHKPVLNKKIHSLCNNSADWYKLKGCTEKKGNSSIPLKSPEQIETAVTNLSNLILRARKAATTYVEAIRNFYIYPKYILQKIKWNRMLKYISQKQRTKINDAKLNVVVREAKQLIRYHRNEKFYYYLSNISPDKDTS